MTIGLCAAAFVTVSLYFTRRPRLVFLAAWILALNYVRWYSPASLGRADNPHALIAIGADLPFFVLLLLWGYDTAINKHKRLRSQNRLWVWFVPLLAMLFLSLLGAEQQVWAGYEWFRLAKCLLILLYVRANVGRNEWWTCVVAFGTAVVGQSILASSQFATGRVVTLLGVTSRRASGSMLHPDVLAGYLLLLLPMFLALGLTVPHRLVRRLCLLIAIAGVVGLVATQSRVPLVLFAGQAIALAVALTSWGWLTAKRTLGLAAVSTSAVLLAATPFFEQIYARATENIQDAFEFRLDLNRMALEILREQPLLGVGPGNLDLHLRRRLPNLEWAFLWSQDAASKGVRFPVTVHNFYLFTIVEGGVLSLGAALVFFLAVVHAGLRAVRVSYGVWNVASFGLLLGVLGVLGQQVTEFTMAIESILYTFVLVAGMLGQVPDLAGPSKNEAA
jgi:O-antigen ligase